MTGLARRQTAPPAGTGRLEAATLLSAVVLFCSGYVLAVTAPGASYSWQHNMVSDLGAAACRAWDGRWICSPRATWFNAAQLGAGACVLLATARLTRRWGRALSAGMASLGVGLIVLAVFPSDVAADPHLAGAVLTLPVPGVGLLVSGVAPPTAWLRSQRWLLVALGVAVLVLCAGHLIRAAAFLPPGTSETLAVAAVLSFLTAQGWRCARCGGRRAGSARIGDLPTPA